MRVLMGLTGPAPQSPLPFEQPSKGQRADALYGTVEVSKRLLSAPELFQFLRSHGLSNFLGFETFSHLITLIETTLR